MTSQRTNRCVGRSVADAAAWSADLDDVLDGWQELPAHERDAWLAMRCADDDELRGRVDAALQRLARMDDLMAEAATSIQHFITPMRTAAALGATLGHYRIVREIGRGGMGVVYLAERADGNFEQQVALKVLLPTADTAALRARFVAERQILATLSHPNIAQLLDGGVTDDGVQYLVMEYAPGLPITEYCRQHALDSDACLRLFLRACSAVHHAHRRLVLHRDIKPGNIIVTESGDVKLLDFGIARFVADGATSHATLLTYTDCRAMTPAYASPEQLRGDALTTASDVYALGLILYEMLTCVQAYVLPAGTAPTAVALLAVREVPPLRPSTRAPARVRRLRRDVDAIVMMTLRYTPEARYGSAEMLATDISRSLDGLPVQAHRGGTLYRISRFMQRHALTVSMAAAAVVALLTGTAAAIIEARRADQALVQSQLARREADAVRDYLLDMFEPEDPSEGRRDTVSTAELLLRGVNRAERLASEPLVQAQLFDALSQVQQSLGDVRASQRLLQRALTARRSLLGSAAPLTSDTEERLAELHRVLAEYGVAESLAATALRGRIVAGAARGQAASLRQLGMLAVYRGDLIRAESLVTRAVQLQDPATASDSITVISLEALGAIQWRRGHMAQSVATLRIALHAARQLYGYPHLTPARLLLRLAEGQQPDTLARLVVDSLARAAVTETEAALGPWSFRTAIALDNASVLLVPRAGLPDREQTLRRAVAIERRILRPRHQMTIQTLLELALELSRQRRFAASDSARTEAVTTAEALYGSTHPVMSGILVSSGELLLARGQYDEAERSFREAVRQRSRDFGVSSVPTALATIGVAKVSAARGDVERADATFATARAALLNHMAPEHPDVVRLDTERSAMRARVRTAP